MGTPEYLAPEMVRALMKRRMGRESPPYTEAVDLWALGCLLFELLAGRTPFAADDDDATEAAVLAHAGGLPAPPDAAAAQLVDVSVDGADAGAN